MPKMILAGIVSSLSPQDLDNIRSVFSAVVRGDGYKVGELFLDRSKHFCTDRESFIKGGFYFYLPIQQFGRTTHFKLLVGLKNGLH